MMMANAEDLTEGDKLTMDGLKICEVVNTDATRGLGGTREGYELRDVEKDGEDDVFFKMADQINLRWRKIN
jgi:translation elongation factor P/translation initiation factor 5A